MIFISHKETDAVLAKALVEFLHASLNIAPRSIRCTSVPGFQLPFGTTISGQLLECNCVAGSPWPRIISPFGGTLHG